MLYFSKPKNFQPKFEIVSLYLESDGKILLLHRRPDESQGGKWGVPAGKVEAGEDLTQALSREVLEETGLRVSPKEPTYLRTVYGKHPEHSYVYHMFHLSKPTELKVTINEYEHRAFRWVSPKAALSMHLVDGLHACINTYYFP